MSLWLDMLGTEIRFVSTPSFGNIRIAEAGKGNPETIIFQHGLNGHLEAYAKNLIALSKDFHVIAFDYVGHGLSSKPDREYTPAMLADQLGELMDVLGIERAHLSRELLGDWAMVTNAGCTWSDSRFALRLGARFNAFSSDNGFGKGKLVYLC